LVLTAACFPLPTSIWNSPQRGEAPQQVVGARRSVLSFAHYNLELTTARFHPPITIWGSPQRNEYLSYLCFH
jgi:hypothetical protein